MASCYHKDTSTNVLHFILPMNNMKMCPTSNNLTVKTPKVKKLPKRQSKVRRKEVDKNRKSDHFEKEHTIKVMSRTKIIKARPFYQRLIKSFAKEIILRREQWIRKNQRKHTSQNSKSTL